MESEKVEKPKRGVGLTIYLVYVLVFNTLGALSYIFAKSMNEAILSKNPFLPRWTISYLLVGCILNLIAGFAVWKLKKWGVYLYAANMVICILFYIFTHSALWMSVYGVCDLSLLIFFSRRFWKPVA